jgi:sterol desaturase/sphingolipid hydroxylase (fatty acid hydroxylase superfamily)
MTAYLTEHLHILLWLLVRSGVWLVITAAIFVPLERLFALHPQKVFRKEVAVDVGYYFLNGVAVGLLLGGPLAIIAVIARHAVPATIIAMIAAWPMWLRACAAMVVGEAGYYWGHRASHQIPFLWRFHAVHHSAEGLDFLVNSRQHPVDLVFSRLCTFAPILALGLINPVRASDGIIPLIILLVGSMWGFFVHSNVRWQLRPLEWVLATPGFHHWHHTSGGRRRDCNYASMLPWLDRIFGTHYLPSEWPERYGIDEPMAKTLAGQLVQPFQEPSPTPSRSQLL